MLPLFVQYFVLLSERVVLAQHQSSFVVSCLNPLSEFAARLASKFVNESISGNHLFLDFHQIAVLFFIVALFYFAFSDSGAVGNCHLARLSAFQHALLCVLGRHVH